MQLEVELFFRGKPVILNRVGLTNASDNRFSITRLDFLASGLSLQQGDGAWLDTQDWFAYFSAGTGSLSTTIEGVPAGKFRRIRFQVGVPPAINASDPNTYEANDPLHPQQNGLHWGWQGGYVFMALEGRYQKSDGSLGGFSYHVANDDNLMKVDLPVEFDSARHATVTLALDVSRIFDGTNRIDILAGESTHSRPADPLAAKLKANIETAFTVTGVGAEAFHPQPPPRLSATSAATNATSFPLRVSTRLPRPPLPEDNPLTNEGVELGRKLFFDKRLARNDSLACADCHQPEAAFADSGRKFSQGVEGQLGSRNSMPLHNLIWGESFFWDGRARQLREQVLIPIEDPLEMDQPLAGALEKLVADVDYPGMFHRAFGTPEINAPRLGLALEQFLITLISQESKFDRAVRGEVDFTEEEKRGFELFITEHDPKLNLFGADCFHCHGGSLFSNFRFMNNGLDATFSDVGRFRVTNDEADRGKFKVPSLRNIELTAPYMHDGRFATLEDVIAHYNSGVKQSATLDPNLAKHLPAGLNLSGPDKAALISFLKTLTDRGFGNTAINQR